MCVNGTCDQSIGECQCDDGFIGNACSIGNYTIRDPEQLTLLMHA